MRSSPRRSGAENLSDAIIASGLVKNAAIIHKIDKNDQNEEKETQKHPKKSLLKGTPSFIDLQMKPKSQIRTPTIEEVILDRQINGPLPKLKSESSILRSKSSQQQHFKSEPFNIYPTPPEPQQPTKEQVSQLLPADEPVTFPAVYFAEKAIGKAGIASRENYDQMNNMLHSLTAEASTDVNLTKDEKLQKQKDAYDTVLSELVRQSFFECGAKGEILQNVRDFMVDSVEQIPVLRNKIDKQKEIIKKNIEDMQKQKKEHEKEVDDLENQLSDLRVTNETLKEHASFYEQKIPALETEHRNLRSLISDLRKQNETLQKGLKEAKEVAEEATTKESQAKDSLVISSKSLVDLGNQFKDLQEKYASQQKASTKLEEESKEKDKKIKELEEKLNSLIEGDEKENNENKEEDKEKNKDDEEKTADKEEITEEGSKTQENNNETVHKLKKKVTYADALTQTSSKLQVRKKKASTKEFEEEVKDPSHGIVPGQLNKERLKEFEKMKSDYNAVSSILGENQISLEQWNEIRTVVLKKNDIFQVSSENYVSASTGSFSLNHPYTKECNLFAKMMMSGIMDRIFKGKISYASRAVQASLIKETKSYTSVDTQVSQSLLQSKAKKDAFTKLLDPNYSDRPPRTFEWTIKAIRSIFDEKTLRDAKDISDGKSVSSMPDFAFDWSKRQYGLTYLVHQCAWDLINSAREHQYKAIEVSLFRQFIDLDMSTEQLTFFLRVRATALRKGVTCIVQTEEDQINYSCTFLASYQAIDLIKSVLQKAGETTINEAVRKVRNKLEKRPSPTLDEKILYISLGNILDICVSEFALYERLQLKKLINTVHIVPMPSNKEFSETMLNLIPTLTHQEIADLYRISVQYSKDNVETDLDELENMFRSRSLLSKENAIPELEVPANANTKEYQLVNERWNKMKDTFNGAIEIASNMKQNPSLSQAILTLEAEMTNVCSSLTCYDICGAHRGLLSCTMALQNLMWTIKEPDPDTMDQVTQSINMILFPQPLQTASPE